MKALYMSTVTDATAPVVLAVIIVVIDMQQAIKIFTTAADFIPKSLYLQY